MDNWDPMMEDFVDTVSSTVSNQGPLKNYSRKENFNDGKVKSFKECDRLHIKNIPMNMTSDNLQDCLSNHGNVLSVRMVPHNDCTKKYKKLAAIANVQSSQDVINIIAALNDKEPLCLKLEKALTNEERLKRKNNYPNFQPERNDNHTTNHEDTEIAEEKPLHNNTEPLMSLKKMLDSCMKSRSKMENPNEVENSANKIKIKDVSAVSSIMEVPEIIKSVLHISRGNGKRFKNPYPCVRCGIMGMKRCSVCKAYYCSKECQEDDWFYHLKICKPPPKLEEIDYETAVEVSKEINLEATVNQLDDSDVHESEHFIKFNKDNSPKYSKSKTSSGKPLRKPLGHNHKIIDNIIATGNNIEYISKRGSLLNGHVNGIQSSINDIVQNQSMLSLETRTEFSPAYKENSSCNGPNSNLPDNIVNNLNLKSVTFAQDKVDILETSKYKIQKLMEKIDYVHSNDSTNKTKSMLKDLCINACETVDASTKKVAANVGSSIETKDIITGVKGTASNVFNSKMKDVIDTNEKVIENVTAKYECGKIYEVYVISKESEKDFNVIAQFECTDVILCAEQSRLSAGTLLMHTELNCNEVIVAKSVIDNEWYRARICSEETDGFVKVCYIDYGNIEDVKEIRSLPEEFNCLRYPGLAMNVTLHKNITSEQLSKFDEFARIDEKIKFKVIATKASSIKIVFIDEYDQELAVCIMKPWQLRKLTTINGNGPSVNGQVKDNTMLSINSSSGKFFKRQLKSLIIGNGQEYNVILTWILEDLSTILQMASEENLKLVADVIKKTALHCDKASKPSLENLMENELVCAFLDDVWYRGEIISFSDDGINVHFLDFGNTNVVPFDNIRTFDSSLLDIPILCLKVKPIVNHQQRQKATDLFNSLLVKEEKFVMKVVSLEPLEAVMMNCQGKDLFSATSIQINHLNTITEEPFAEHVVHFVETDQRTYCENLSNSQPLKKFYRKELTPLTVVNGEEYAIVLTWILEGLHTFLHIVSPENANALIEMVERTAAHCQKASKLSMDQLTENEVVCAFFEDMWYRGEIISISDNGISVYFLDFGNTDIVPLNNLRAFDSSLLDFPILCLKVKPIVNHQQRQKAKDLFNSLLVKEEKFVMKVVSLEPLEAVMMDCQGKDLFPDISQTTTTLPSNPSPTTQKNITPITGESIDKKVTQLLQSGAYKPIFKSWDECESVFLPIQNDVDVFIMKASDIQNIYVVPEIYSNLFDKLDELSLKFNEYCSTIKTPYYAPNVGEVVLAKYSEDEKWYRAACVDVQQEMADIFFVDYGSIEKVHFKNLCQMIDVFLDIPLFVLHCILGDATKERLVNRQEDYLSNFGNILLAHSFNTVDVLSHSSEDGTYVIEIPSLCSSPKI